MAQPPPISPSRWTNPLPISPTTTTTSTVFSSAFDSASFNLLRPSSSLPISTSSSSNFWRKQSGSATLSPSLLSEDSSSSMLGMDEGEEDEEVPEEEEVEEVEQTQEEEDVPMTFDLTLPDNPLPPSRHIRRNSSDFMSVSTYSVSGGQRTPPPFLNRRLYADQDSSGNLDLGGGIARRTSDPVLEGVEEDGMGFGIPDRTRARETGSGSTSGSGEESRVRVRALSRKPNLLPKSKSHLRVLSQLRTEDELDSFEINSEATLHRLSKSGATIHRASMSGPVPPSPFQTGNTSNSRPTPNRFPEQDEEESANNSDISTGDELEVGALDDIGEMGSDWGGNSMGYGTEDEEETARKASIWTGIRGGGGGSAGLNVGALGFGSRSPGSERGRAELEMQMQAHNNSPSTSAWHPAVRAGKRKNADDRFEPYAQAFKRRAVSPANSLGPLGSPVLSFASSASFPTPPPLSLHSLQQQTSASLSLPIQIPSPTFAQHSFFSNLNYGSSNISSRSRGGSPVPSSLSSSAGRSSYMGNGGSGGIAMIFSGRAEREDAEKNGKETGDGLGRMTLG